MLTGSLERCKHTIEMTKGVLNHIEFGTQFFIDILMFR